MYSLHPSFPLCEDRHIQFTSPLSVACAHHAVSQQMLLSKWVKATLPTISQKGCLCAEPFTHVF